MGGREQAFGSDQDERIGTAFAKMSPIIETMASSLKFRKIEIRGARCMARRRRRSVTSHRLVSVDLRLRAQKANGSFFSSLVEMTWHEKSVRPAKRRAKAKLGKLRKLLKPGCPYPSPPPSSAGAVRWRSLRGET